MFNQHPILISNEGCQCLCQKPGIERKRKWITIGNKAYHILLFYLGLLRIENRSESYADVLLSWHWRQSNGQTETRNKERMHKRLIAYNWSTWVKENERQIVQSFVRCRRERRTLHHLTTCLTRWTNIMCDEDEKRNISSSSPSSLLDIFVGHSQVLHHVSFLHFRKE